MSISKEVKEPQAPDPAPDRVMGKPRDQTILVTPRLVLPQQLIEIKFIAKV